LFDRYGSMYVFAPPQFLDEALDRATTDSLRQVLNLNRLAIVYM
jgi:hypothetical protein